MFFLTKYVTVRKQISFPLHFKINFNFGREKTIENKTTKKLQNKFKKDSSGKS